MRASLIRTCLWACVIILIITLLVFTIIRSQDIRAYICTGISPREGTIEYGYTRQSLLTLLHILPGILFIVLGALQFVRPLRDRWIRIHRTMGRIYLILGVVVGVTAIIMAFVIRFGGVVETAAVVIFGPYLLACLGKAYSHIRKKQTALHREWMIRAYSIGLAVATMRPVIGLLAAFTDIPFNEFFGYTFWFAFILHVLAAEAWIRSTRELLND